MTTLEAHSFASTAIPRPIPPTYFQATSDLLIQSADQALYQAKKDGGNRLSEETAVEWPMLETTRRTPLPTQEEEAEEKVNPFEK